MVENLTSALVSLPSIFGDYSAQVYVDPHDKSEHLALVFGAVDRGDEVMVRLHSECLTGDVFGSLRCDCRHQLQLSLRKIAEYGRGVLLYLRQEGRGIGLLNKIRAYDLQARGLDTFAANEALGLPADARDYQFAGSVLKQLGVTRVVLLTNNPEKVTALRNCGITVVRRVNLGGGKTKHNWAYLTAKVSISGHDPNLLA